MEVPNKKSATTWEHQTRKVLLQPFVHIAGTALKKDNVQKHSNSEMHHKASDIERRPSIKLASLYNDR